MKTPSDPPPSIKRHSRKCAVCTHPDRQAIDEAFLHQSRTHDIVKDYKLPSLSSLYRHAQATGLWPSRNSNRENSRCPAADSNRENKARPAERTPPEPSSNRESNQLETSANPTNEHADLNPNREINAWYSAAARLTVTAEIQRMLIGK
jgi:hypothetical protein